MLVEAAQVLLVLLITKGHTPPSFDLSCTSCFSPATGSPAAPCSCSQCRRPACFPPVSPDLTLAN